jgi:hypothetical protein
MLASIAEFENDIRRERQSDGIAKAKIMALSLALKLNYPINNYLK